MDEVKLLFILFLRWPKFFGTLAFISIVGIVIEMALHSGQSSSIIPGGAIDADYPFGSQCHPVVTQLYGPVNNNNEPVIGGIHFHTGIDLACPAGSNVFSTTNGVAHVTLGYGGGYGNNVVVEFLGRLVGEVTDHHIFVRYAHLQTVVVGNGSLISPGQLIGTEGSTGNSTGPHLHYEVDENFADGGHSVNPAPYLKGI